MPGDVPVGSAVMADPLPFTLEETARRLGNYAWTELRVSEVLGGWVATTAELEVKLALGTQCYHHAWHAELWHRGLPELREMRPDRLTVPANDQVVALLDAISEADATIERLVGAYRVLLPRKIAAYTHHLERSSAVADAPVIRSLRFALGDEMDDWRAGEMLLQSLISTADEVGRAARHQARLEALAIAAGGVTGPASGGPPAGA